MKEGRLTMSSDSDSSLKGEALEALQESFDCLLDEERAKGDAPEVEGDFVARVLDCAWSHQFDDTPAAFKRSMKALLREAAQEKP